MTDNVVPIKGEQQISEADKKAADTLVARMNKEYAVIIAGDRAAILQELIDDRGRKTFRLLSLAAFSLWLANRTVQFGETRIKLAQYWLAHRERRQYNSIVFAPNIEVPGAYNLWRGFAVEPIPGDCSNFLHHLLHNACHGNNELYQWVLGWLASIFQSPRTRYGTSLVFRGPQGVGKTKIGEVVGSLLGSHYTLVAEPRYITGRFNSHLTSCLLLHADESFWAGDRAAEGKLKDLITGYTHLVEFKGKEPFEVPNYVRLLVTSNSDWVVPAAMQERRFATLDMGEAHMQDKAYFAAIDDEMNKGGREALLHFLLNFDLSSVDLRTIPQTSALIEQKIKSLTPEQGWWLDILSRGELPFNGYESAVQCPRDRMFDHYIERTTKTGVRHKGIETALGMFLSKMVPGLLRSRSRYTFPALAECRAAFANAMQIPEQRWQEPNVWRKAELLDEAHDKT